MATPSRVNLSKNEAENVDNKAEEASSVKPEEVAAEVMTEESESEIETNDENAEEIAENADAQVDEAKPSQQLIIELDSKRDQVVGTSLPSPMVQLDGPIDERKVKYTFLSEYAEEDIKYTIDEIFPMKKAILSSMVQSRPQSAECLCTVEVKIESGEEFVWPEMDKIQVQVLQDLKQTFC